MNRKTSLLWCVSIAAVATIAFFLNSLLGSYFVQPPEMEKTATHITRPNASKVNDPKSDNRVQRTSATDFLSSAKASVALPKTNESELYNEFNTTKDIAAFVNRAKSVEGGQYFVRMALLHCGSLDAQGRSVAITKAQQEKNSEERSEAINRAFGACANMPSGAALRDAIRETKSDRSIVLAEAFNQYLVGNSEGSIAGFVSRAISTGNPALLDQMLAVLIPTAEASGNTEIAFDGKSIDRNDYAALSAALGLVACNFGGDCSGQSQASISGCAFGGPCGVDAFEIVRKYNKTPVEWERVLQFYSKVLDAYQSGNFAIVNVVKRKR